MPARLQLSFSPLAGQPSSLFEEAIYSRNVFAFFVSLIWRKVKSASLLTF